MQHTHVLEIKTPERPILPGPDGSLDPATAEGGGVARGERYAFPLDGDAASDFARLLQEIRRIPEADDYLDVEVIPVSPPPGVESE